jgi:hypothetical protein
MDGQGRIVRRVVAGAFACLLLAGGAASAGGPKHPKKFPKSSQRTVVASYAPRASASTRQVGWDGIYTFPTKTSETSVTIRIADLTEQRVVANVWQDGTTPRTICGDSGGALSIVAGRSVYVGLVWGSSPWLAAGCADPISFPTQGTITATFTSVLTHAH